jgi:peptide deformylase
MTVRELEIYPSPVLRQECQLIEVFDAKLSKLLDDLAESMYAHQGLGLAAPQIGEAVKVAVVDVDQRDGASRLIELVNPEIVDFSKELFDYEEGCLSFPDECELVTRPLRITIKAQDRLGAPFEITAEGLLSTAMQHEIDHLNGKLFIDYISRLKRSMVERRMQKRARKNSN